MSEHIPLVLDRINDGSDEKYHKSFNNYSLEFKFTSSKSHTFHRWIYAKNAFYESQRWRNYLCG